VHKVSQYKVGKPSVFAQGKRRYDRKQKWLSFIGSCRVPIHDPIA